MTLIKPSRRQFFMNAGATGLALSLPAFRASAQDTTHYPQLESSGSIVICTWGGPTDDRIKQFYMDSFKEQYGLSWETTSFPDVAKLEVMNQIKSVEWDLIDYEGTQMNIAVSKSLLRPIDYEMIYSIVPKEQLNPHACREFGIGSVAFSTNMGWSTEMFPEGPQNWIDFFDDAKFKGRRGLYAQPRPSFEIAMMAVGTPRDQIYQMTLDDAFEALDAIKSKVHLWVERTSQWGVILQNKEVDLVGASLGRLVEEKKGGAYDYHFKDNVLEQSYWTIPANAPAGDEAMKALAWFMRAEGQLGYAEAVPSGMTNLSVYDKVSAEAAAMAPTNPVNMTDTVMVDDVWWTVNAEEAQLRWLEWMSS